MERPIGRSQVGVRRGDAEREQALVREGIKETAQCSVKTKSSEQWSFSSALNPGCRSNEGERVRKYVAKRSDGSPTWK